MRVLKFIVTGQSIKKSPECDFSDIVAGSIGYLKASFEFSDEWDDCEKVAMFWNDDETSKVHLDENNSCAIQANVLTTEKFYVSVVGKKAGYRIVSADTKVTQEKNAATEVCDDTLVVDLDTRVINIPDSVTNIGVMSDDGVCVLHFQIPQYYGNIDLSTFEIRVNYVNVKGEGDVYEVMSREVANSMIYFDWEVGRNAVAYNGEVNFIVCLKDVDENGNVLRELNTTIATLPALPGLETGEAIVSEYSDLLEQWKTELFQSRVDAEEIESAVKDYLEQNPVEGTSFETDETLSLVDGVLSVNTADAVEEDNSLPVTSAAVQTVVGNVEVLLKTI